MAVCLVFGIAFFLLKGRAALFVSGFNSLPKNEQERYDREALARDMGKSCFVWSLVMAAGCALSRFLSPYAAIAAFVVSLVLLFKDVRQDASKALEANKLSASTVCMIC